jgi:tetratricopeptide (TPR) repeat protein
MNSKRISIIIFLFLIPLYITQLLAGGEWYKIYEDGIEAMEDGDYKTASDLFIQAIQDNPDDDENVRTYGMHSIEYFPHRELGICLYHLGDKTGAQLELQISMKMEPSDRAKQYLGQLGADLPPPKKVEPVKDVAIGVVATPAVDPKKETEMIVGKQTIKLVGERMGVAVLPFENKGASHDLGEIILDKMITVLWTQDRFKVMERAALNQVLAEQSLGQSGALDATTAAEIGKGIGVDAIVIGSVAAAPSGALSIDTRVIDTESAAIIVANDAYTGSSDAQSVKNAVENLARKITESH